MKASQPVVSIIIPTLNAGCVLRRCLESIAHQDYSALETIVVDQSSTDQTAAIARRYGARVLTLPAPKFYSPPSQSRNRGAAEAKGDILYHLDADMSLPPTLASEIVRTFNGSAQTGALIVHEEDQTDGYWARCKALERRCYWGNDRIESARVVRRSVFNQIGGYDEAIHSGEDFDIHRRYQAVTTIEWLDQPAHHHLGRLGFWSSVRKKYYYGKTATSYIKKQKASGRSARFVPLEELRSYARYRALLWRHPTASFGMFALKFSELTALLCGLIISKLSRARDGL